jgi:hypothetical protein
MLAADWHELPCAHMLDDEALDAVYGGCWPVDDCAPDQDFALVLPSARSCRDSVIATTNLLVIAWFLVVMRLPPCENFS